MARSIWPLAAMAVLFAFLSGCGMYERPQRPAWRGQAEKICLAENKIRASAYVQPIGAIEGPGICGLDHPFKVSALADGTVELHAQQTIGCPLAAALDQWVTEVVQPIALARFGQKVQRINSMGAYSCRSIDNMRGAKLSEHAFGNAIDIGGFHLADGHDIVVVKAWTHGDDQEQAFLREVQAGACNIFTTVLAPGSDAFHYNHIHLDLAMHGQTSTGPRRYCKPRPSPQLTPAPSARDGLPDAPDVEEELDVARGGPGAAGPNRSIEAIGSLNAATPPPVRPQSTPQRAYAASSPRPPLAIGAYTNSHITAPQAQVTRGAMGDDGVFTPEEDDSTSSIGRPRH